MEQTEHTVCTAESANYYDAVLAYWQAVQAHGEQSDAAAQAAMHMLAELVRARQAGAPAGELQLLRVMARWMVCDERA